MRISVGQPIRAAVEPLAASCDSCSRCFRSNNRTDRPRAAGGVSRRFHDPIPTRIGVSREPRMGSQSPQVAIKAGSVELPDLDNAPA